MSISESVLNEISQIYTGPSRALHHYCKFDQQIDRIGLVPAVLAMASNVPSVPCNVLSNAGKGNQLAVSFKSSGCDVEGLTGDGKGNGEGEGQGQGGDHSEGSSSRGGFNGDLNKGGGEEDQKNQLSGD